MQYTYNKILSVFVLLISITACGEDAFVSTDGNTNKPATADTVINAFSVSGTDVQNGVEVIDTSEPFSINWNISSSSTYSFEVWLSSNDELSATDIKFFSGTCGPGDDCGVVGEFDCSFVKTDTDTTLACNESPNPVDISAVVSGASPTVVTSYIFLKADNQAGTSEKTASPQKVLFEF